VPLQGEVVLSLRPSASLEAGRHPGRPGHRRGRHRRLRPPSGCGCLRLGLRGRPGQAATRPRWGARWPPTPAASTSLRHGDTRAQVIGVEAVLGTGATISHLGGLVKGQHGYHLPGLLCGSEGTLAVVTGGPTAPGAGHAVPDRRRAGLLHGHPRHRCVVAPAPVASHPRGVRALPRPRGLELVCSTMQLPMPFPIMHPVYLLVEMADRSDPTDTMAEAVDSLDEPCSA